MIDLPATTAEEWRRLLADPETQWVPGYSAHSMAHCWQSAGDIPPEVRNVLSNHPTFATLQALIIIPEHKVALPGGGRASQTDVWALACGSDGLVSLAVEGKVNETFGPTLDEWLIDASDGKRKRLAYLCDLLGLNGDLPGKLRYQLFHRTASVVIEAKRFCARHAIMMVQSWSRENRWFGDFEQFVAQFGGIPQVDKITKAAISPSNIALYFAWCRGNSVFCHLHPELAQPSSS